MKTCKRFFAIALVLMTLITMLPLQTFASHSCKYYLGVVDAVAPTCTEYGYSMYYKCTYCSAMYRYSDATGRFYSTSTVRVNKTDHDYGYEIVEPKCNAQGYTLGTCVDCGATTKKDYVSSYSKCVHMTQVPAKDPTCTEAGNLEYYTCDDCNKWYTDSTASTRTYEKNVTVAATGHTHVPTVTPPTCLVGGYTTYTCHCGDTYVADQTEPSMYCSTIWQIYEDSTCTTQGHVGYYICEHCNTWYYDYLGKSEILDHDDILLPLAEHRYTEAEIIPATCQEGGYTIRTCGDCGHTVKDSYTSANKKCSVVKVGAVAANCTQYGVKSHYKCTTCGALYSNSKATKRITDPAKLNVKMTKHSMGSWQVRVPSSETQEGEQFRKCKTCDYEETKVLPCITLKLAAPKVTIKRGADGKPILSWKSVKSAKTYLIYRVDENGEKTFLASTTAKSYTDKSAEAGKVYSYTVNATSAKNYGAYSNVVSIQCGCTAPTKLSFSYEETTGKTIISWDAVEGAAQYYLYIGTKSKGPFTKVTVDGTSYTHTDAVAGKKYYYKLQVVAAQTGADSAQSKAFSYECRCSRPTELKADASASSIKLTWKAVPGAKSYDIYRANSKNGPFKKIGSAKTTSYTDKKMTPLVPNYYAVVAKVKSSGSASAYSEAASAVAVTKTPAMYFIHGVSGSSISVYWEKVQGASGYYIYRRSSENDSWTRVGTAKSSADYFVDKKVSGYAEYCVTAYTKIGKKNYESPKSNVAYARTLEAPTISVGRSNKEVIAEITVTPVSGAIGYDIYCSTDGKKTWEYLTTVSDGNLTYVHNIDHGVWHYYKAEAFYELGGHASYGPESNVSDWMVYYYPNVKVWMSDSYKSDASLALISVTNKGVGPIRFYSSGARWVDSQYKTFNRNCYIFDVDEFTNNRRLVELAYVDVPAGQTVDIWVMVKGKDTWYDEKTKICMTAYYDGNYYTTYMSSKYGFSYYKQ